MLIPTKRSKVEPVLEWVERNKKDKSYAHIEGWAGYNCGMGVGTSLYGRLKRIQDDMKGKFHDTNMVEFFPKLLTTMDSVAMFQLSYEVCDTLIGLSTGIPYIVQPDDDTLLLTQEQFNAVLRIAEHPCFPIDIRDMMEAFELRVRKREQEYAELVPKKQSWLQRLFGGKI